MVLKVTCTYPILINLRRTLRYCFLGKLSIADMKGCKHGTPFAEIGLYSLMELCSCVQTWTSFVPG